jgi:tRNA modification GTPase
LAEDRLTPGEFPIVTRLRHRKNLEECVAALRDATEKEGDPLEVRAEMLRRAGDAIGRITGRVDAEDLLDVIFSEFCVGK